MRIEISRKNDSSFFPFSSRGDTNKQTKFFPASDNAKKMFEIKIHSLFFLLIICFRCSRQTRRHGRRKETSNRPTGLASETRQVKDIVLT